MIKYYHKGFLLVLLLLAAVIYIVKVKIFVTVQEEE
jgi:hypothetical protein